MKRTRILLFIGLTTLFFSACGGGGGGGSSSTSDSTTTSDTTAPVITINGSTNMVVTQYDVYIEAGATAIDNIDGSVTVSIIGTVDTNTTGSYTITYSVQDSAGNSATGIRQVLVVRVTPVVIKKTGQTSSYNEEGIEVTDNSIKDDGFYQQGLTPQYTRDDENNIVLDHLIGLMWQDNESVRKQWITDENYNDRLLSNTSGDTAITYCSELILGGYDDWRIPTITELQSIVLRSENNPSIDTSVFEAYSTIGFYTSSTLNTNGNEPIIMAIHFGLGTIYPIGLAYNEFVRCVR